MARRFHLRVDQGVIARICFTLVLYFYELEPAIERRAAVLKILDEYNKSFGQKFRWSINPNSYKWKPLKNGYAGYVSPDKWLLDTGEDNWRIFYHGGRQPFEASDVHFWAEDVSLSVVHVNFPLNHFSSSEEYIDLCLRWSNWLKPIHGYGGFFLAEPHGNNYGAGVLFSPILCTVASLLPGVDVSSVSSDLWHLESEIKGVNWLTVVSSELLDKLGGGGPVREALKGGAAEYRPFNEGAVIVAGKNPQLGLKGWDDPVMEPYRQAAKVLEPLRKKDINPFFVQDLSPRLAALLPPGVKYLDEENTLAWAARFSPKGE